MKSAAGFILVLVTAPDLKIGRKLASAALAKRFVACANIIPAIESHYRWHGKIEHTSEVLILFKTTKRHLPALEKLLVANHPYDTPEILTVNLSRGNSRYLQWLASSVQ